MISVGHQIELHTDIAAGKPIRDSCKRINVHAAVTGGECCDRSDIHRDLIEHAQHSVAQTKRAEQVLLRVRDAHDFAIGENSFEVYHLSRQHRCLITDARTHTWRRNSATQRAFCLIKVSDELQTFIGQCRYQSANANPGFCGDRMIVGVDSYDSIKRLHING